MHLALSQESTFYLNIVGSILHLKSITNISDRPNPEPVRQKPNRTEPNVRPNRTFGKTWVPPKRFGLWAEQVRPRSRPNLFSLSEGTQGKEGPNSYSLYGQSLLFSSHCPGYSGFPSGTTAGRRRGAAGASPVPHTT